MITLVNVSLQRGTRTLLQDTGVVIHSGQKVGVIGRNGCGKTSLFLCLTGSITPDAGSVNMTEGTRVSVMQQETPGSARTALEHVVDGDRAYRHLETELAHAEASGDIETVAALHAELDQIDGYTVDHRAQRLLSGLGFSQQDFYKAVDEFSGGWRVRLNLAAALMCPSDLLLLDEPTNHLDLEATIWLEQWLSAYPGTLLIISHDRDFLDRVINSVISFENFNLHLYQGNYSAYEKQRAAKLALQQVLSEKQRRRRAEIEDFVTRFRAKASKARQAQSRLKELQKMQQIVIAHVDSPFRFSFQEPERLPEHLLQMEEISIGFEQPLLTQINLKITASTRIGLLGFNGSGKSTLLKAMAGENQPLAGEIHRTRHLKVGYFAQHQVDVLDERATPLELLQNTLEEKSEQKIRDYLGGYDFRGDRVDTRISNFSGGEKARLALAVIAWQKPNLLLLDEPTNHLDLEMRQALTVALQAFTGALVVISHDRYLLNNTVDSFYLISGEQLQPYTGSLNDYETWLKTRERQSSDGSTIARLHQSNSGPEDRKVKRQQAAARRKAQAPLRAQIKQQEAAMEQMQEKLEALNLRLMGNDLYEDSAKNELGRLLKEQGETQAQLHRLEEKWLELQERLEAQI